MLDEIRRDMARLAVVREQIDAIERARLVRLEQAPATGPHAMVRLLACVIGVGVETADMLVQEVLCRNLRDRREKAKAGNARVRRGLIQLAWRFLRFQKDSALAQWYRADRVSEGRAQNNDDRGARPQTAHRAVAHGHDRRNPGWRCIAAGDLSGLGVEE